MCGIGQGPAAIGNALSNRAHPRRTATSLARGLGNVPWDARPDAVRLALNNQVASTLFGLDDAMLASQGLHPDAPVTRAQALFALYHYL